MIFLIVFVVLLLLSAVVMGLSADGFSTFGGRDGVREEDKRKAYRKALEDDVEALDDEIERLREEEV